MKALCTFLFFLCLGFSLFSQTTLWGTVENGGQYGNGYLYRTDSLGNNLVITHHFNGTDDGKYPGTIMQASNGKLYGMTSQGGHGSVFIMNHPSLGPLYTRGGTLYEYDPVIDSFKVLIHFNSTDPQYPLYFDGPSTMKILEVSPGKLWCVFNLKISNNNVTQTLPRHVAEYNITAQTLTSVVSLPTWNTPSYPTPQNTSLTGQLYKAANGMVYGTTAGYSSCATLHPISIGSVISIDPVSHVFSWASPFTCVSMTGNLPEGKFENVGGKLYSYTRWGGAYTVYPATGYGIIFEYDPATDIITTKYDLTGGIGGALPLGNQLLANNGKLYGTSTGGTPYQNFPNGSGMVYEYDPGSGIYTKKADFIYGYTVADMGSLGQLWVKSSVNGKLYGTTKKGVFEYNTLTNQLRIAARFNADDHRANEIQEICRKPAYKPLAQNSYTLCANGFFSIDLKCYNATSIVWKHNGIPDPLHTGSGLGFSNIALTDAGTWLCEMNNACGTSTFSVSLTVNPAGSAITSTLTPAGSTTICPNSSITLSGNVSGTWNTGSTASSITVSAPGNYQVINTNACGQTYSNIIRIDTLPSPVVPFITFTVSYSTGGPAVLTHFMCPGDSMLLTGNTAGGVWNTGQTSPSVYVKDTQPKYVILTNGCKTVLSATAQASFVPPTIPPAISALGSRTVCVGDSVLLDATGTANYNWYRDNGTLVSYYTYANQFYAKQAGSYFIKLTPSCGPVYSNTLTVTVNGIPLDTAIITPLSSTVICQGSGVVLQSNYASCTWNTGATTQTIMATGVGPYTVTNYNSCSSVTSADMSISVTPLPVVNYTQSQNSVCFTTGTFTLSPGNPAGGYYTGNGVSGNTFDPLLAGAGTHTVAYNYQDLSSGCIGKAIQSILVDGNPLVTAAPSTVFCEGSSTILFQDTPGGVWNVPGQTNQFMMVTQPGNYYVTKTNNCGVTVTSNTLQIISKPSPTVTITGANSICFGDQTVLTGNGAVTYTWTPGGISSNISITPTVSTSYTVLGTGSNGCLGSSITTITVHPLPSVITTNTTVCLGNSAVLSASGATTYSWSTGQIGASVTVTPSINTVYQVTGTNTYSCVNTGTVSVTVNPLPSVPVITTNGTVLSTSPSWAYQWYFNGTALPGATSQTITITEDGDYTVMVYNQNGCSAMSAVHTVIGTGLSASAGQSVAVEVYPNPTAGNFTVHTPFSDYRIEIVNTLGQVVMSGKGSFHSEFNLEKNGLYMIHVISNGYTYIKKLVVSGQ